jgi:pilus assembly protein FimV
MLRNRAVALILCCTASTLAFALGLGPLQSNSTLNAPFSGRIEIIGAGPDDLDTLKVSLAPLAQFQRAGVTFAPVLSNLRFTLDDTSGDKAYIRVTSQEAIREPFLNFLLEINWLSGRLVREYTVLLDPPLYDPNRRRAVSAAPAAPAAPSPAAPAPAAVVMAPRVQTSSPLSYGSGGTIGPIGSGETLWALASRHRPDASASIQQMMLALLRENPDAFIEGNVNRLRRGAVLRLPDEASIKAVSARDALAEVQRQHELWQSYRGQVAAAAPPQPMGPPVLSAPAETIVPPADDGARLELVAPGDEAEAGGVTAGDASAGTGSDLLREEMDTRERLATELESKLAEAEEIIDMLQRQVSIKDEELAALQARLAELGIEHGDLTPTADSDDTTSEPDPTVGDDTSLAMDDLDPAPTVSDDGIAPVTADPESAAPVAQPSAERGFPLNLVPEHIAAMVPGGSLTILGGGAALLLALLVAVMVLLLKRRADGSQSVDTNATIPAPIPAPVLASAAAASAATVAPDDDAEASTDLGLEPVFDPNRTIEALGSETVTELPVAAPPQAAEDPLEEVNVYLAYERFDQAEELVKRVIDQYPDRHEYKLRLLEVYYSSNDRSAYESAARELLDAVGETDALWTSAVAMWSEMSPEREMFAEGAASEIPEPHDSASAFVDITGDTAGNAIGDGTLTRAPVEADDGGLDFDIGGAANDDESILDLSDDDVIDLTAAADDDNDDELFDLTGGADTGGGGLDTDGDTIDVTGGGYVAQQTAGDTEMLDIGAGDDLTELLDITGGDATDQKPAATEGDMLDLESLSTGYAESGDLLDVTNTGDFSAVEDGDLLNVTAPGIRASEDLDGVDDVDEFVDLTAAADDEAVLDFDISDTVAPAFAETPPHSAADNENFLDLSGGAGDEGALDFDIGGLDDTAVGVGAFDLAPAGSTRELDHSDTVDMAAEFDTAATADESAIDFDITMGSNDLSGAMNVVEKEDDTGRLEITMSSYDTEPVDGELSLQGPDLEQFAIDVEGNDDYNLALDGTIDMYSVAADETLDMATVKADSGGFDLDTLEEVGLDTVEIEPFNPDRGVEEDPGLLDSLSLADDEATLLDFDSQSTVVMPQNELAMRQTASDEADTKLSLAKAYIELGDTEGARSILAEVTADGNAAQRAEAASLLAQFS